MIEPVLLLVVFVMALLAGSTNLGEISTQVATRTLPYSMGFWLSMASFAFATFVEMGKLPFDVSEAEQELQEGALAEYSGRSLAIMKWGIYLKQLVLVALFFSMFIPFGSMTALTPIGIIVAVVAFGLKAFIFFLVVAVIENIMARTRFIRAPAATWLALGSAVLSFVFYLANV
jgi:hydrogenase-4 component C